MNNKDCKIIKDLLPSYIDGLTSKETNEFIKKHISECSDCSIVYENMKSNISNSNYHSDFKQINGFKKVNKKIKVLKTSLIIFLLIALFVSIFLACHYRKYMYLLSKAATVYADNINKPHEICYAIIEEITDKNVNYRAKYLKLSAINDMNEKNWQGEFNILIAEDTAPALLSNGKELDIDKLKVGQKITLVCIKDQYFLTESDINSFPEIVNASYLIVNEDQL